MESGRVETPDDLRSGRPEEELLELLCDALRELYVLTSKGEARRSTHQDHNRRRKA